MHIYVYLFQAGLIYHPEEDPSVNDTYVRTYSDDICRRQKRTVFLQTRGFQLAFPSY